MCFYVVLRSWRCVALHSGTWGIIITTLRTSAHSRRRLADLNIYIYIYIYKYINIYNIYIYIYIYLYKYTYTYIYLYKDCVLLCFILFLLGDLTWKKRNAKQYISLTATLGVNGLRSFFLSITFGGGVPKIIWHETGHQQSSKTNSYIYIYIYIMYIYNHIYIYIII